jgi:hypothetical protein
MTKRVCPLFRDIFMGFACLAIVWGSGCIPLPEHGLLAGRGKIDEADIAFLKIGVTTREEVVLRFGEPDIVLFDQRIMAYSWTVSVGIYGGQYSAGDIPRDHIFMLEFDNEGRLSRAEMNSSGWVGRLTMLEKWIEKSENASTRGNSLK